MKKLFFIALFVTSFTISMAQLNMEELGFLPYSQELSDVWGYADEDENEYALVGVYNGLSIVDVTDPENPTEVFFGPGPESIWRDIKTWGDYAYVSNETSGGVYIVDLSPLPNGSITNTNNFTGSIYPFSNIHNLYIDEFGKLYIFGANSGSGGAIICDLTADPMNPVELGRFDAFYLHDGMARGDTLWGAGIYQGVLAAIDVSDPSDPVIMGTVSTPSQFTHNAWVSGNGSHVFTTDEVSSGYIGSYNVTEVSNMFEVDRIRSASGSDVIPHNVHVHNDFLVTSYYTDGIVVHDALYPDRLVEVANFDTSPNFSGSGFSGSWGAYPFLPSGVILASDIEEGLYILDIDYVRAAFLEGFVTSTHTGAPLFNVQIEVLGTGLSTQTAFDGSYEFGTTISGTYDVEFSKPNYITEVVEDVVLENGIITDLDVEMGQIFVGIDDEEPVSEMIKAFPNPFSDQLTFEYNLAAPGGGQYAVSLFNSIGKLQGNFVLTGSEGTISMGSELPPGIYFIRIEREDQVVETRRVIKR
jgi:choice-of-anchor B domain-containing protein